MSVNCVLQNKRLHRHWNVWLVILPYFLAVGYAVYPTVVRNMVVLLLYVLTTFSLLFNNQSQCALGKQGFIVRSKLEDRTRVHSQLPL